MSKVYDPKKKDGTPIDYYVDADPYQGGYEKVIVKELTGITMTTTTTTNSNDKYFVITGVDDDKHLNDANTLYKQLVNEKGDTYFDVAGTYNRTNNTIHIQK